MSSCVRDACDNSFTSNNKKVDVNEFWSNATWKGWVARVGVGQAARQISYSIWVQLGLILCWEKCSHCLVLVFCRILAH